MVIWNDRAGYVTTTGKLVKVITWVNILIKLVKYLCSCCYAALVYYIQVVPLSIVDLNKPLRNNSLSHFVALKSFPPHLEIWQTEKV